LLSNQGYVFLRSPWTGDTVLGRPLSRTEALSSLAKEAFSVVDAVGAHDERVAKWALG
jgi:hypothetical protein